MLGSISEVFVNITGYELAYARAPPNMRSVVMALFLFNTALSQALAELLIPAIKDPHLIVSVALPRVVHEVILNNSQWVWAGPAIALVAQTVIFVWRHHNVNDDAFMVYEEDPPAEIVQAVDTDKK